MKEILGNMLNNMKSSTLVLILLITVVTVVLDVGVKTANAGCGNNITNHDKIQILLIEYETLRTEILQRLNNRFQFIMIIGAICGYAFFKGNSRKVLAGSIALLVVVFVMIWFGHLIASCSRQVSKIEKQVNELVGGETLMEWETYQVDNGPFHKMYKWMARDKQE